MTNSFRVPCVVCDTEGELPDENGVMRVCHDCLGSGYKFENYPTLVGDLPVVALPLADVPPSDPPEPAIEVWAGGEDGAP